VIKIDMELISGNIALRAFRERTREEGRGTRDKGRAEAAAELAVDGE